MITLRPGELGPADELVRRVHRRGADAVSFALALLRPVRAVDGRPGRGHPSELPSWLRVPSYLRLTAANVVFCVGHTVLVTGLPAYLVEGRTGLLVAATLVVTSAYTVGELLHSAGSTLLALDLAPATGQGHHLAFFHLSWAAAPVVAVFPWLAGAGGAALWVPVAVATTAAAAAMARLSPT